MAKKGVGRRVLLVEGHAAFRQALAYLLVQEANVDEEFQVGSLDDCRSSARRCGLGGIDIVVVDPCLPDGDGTDLVRELREAAPYLPVLVLTASQEPAKHVEAFEVGADEVLSKEAPLEEILEGKIPEEAAS